MPTLFIYPPHGEENPYGHVALKTDKFYMSFWTAKVLQSDENEEHQAKRSKRKLINALDALGVLKGHQGGLVIHQDLDKEYEGNCNPIEYEISAVVSNEDVNSVYEEFLRYNEIDPEEVTLSKSDEIFLKRREYETSLSAEEAKKVLEEPELPQKSLPKTQYSFSVELVSGNKEEVESVPFYHQQQQSCVSFIFNLVQTVWLKHHPDSPIPIVLKKPGVVIAGNREGGREFAYDLPWFEEEVVQKYFLTSDIISKSFIATAPILGLGVMFRPFNLFGVVVVGTFFLCCLFPNLVGFSLKVLISYHYGTAIYKVWRKWDRQHIRDLMSHPFNFWLFYYFYTIFYLHFSMMFFKMYDYIYDDE